MITLRSEQLHDRLLRGGAADNGSVYEIPDSALSFALKVGLDADVVRQSKSEALSGHGSRSESVCFNL